MIDPTNVFHNECRPFAEVPAWWSGFLFHVLTARQVTLYIYFCMLGGESGSCNPTVRQILSDLGIGSATAVFGAITTLEDAGFILRQRRGGSPKQRTNFYQRTSCEFTVLRLLETRRIDGLMRPGPGFVNEMSHDARGLLQEWLQSKLGTQYTKYEKGGEPSKRALLLRVFRAERRRGA